MSARPLLMAAKQLASFVGSCVVLFWAFFYAATYAPLAMPNGSAGLLGLSGYFAVVGFLSALAIGLLLRVPFRILFPDRPGTWGFSCSLIAALAYVSVGLDTFARDGMPLWPYVDAVLLVAVFTATAGVKWGKNRAAAI